MDMEKEPAAPLGVRERKRRETLRRITDAGMGLFIAKGYEETTLDEIAAKAGISRRTFFYYFKSKDDILLSLQNSMGEMIVEAIRAAPPGQPPLHAIRDAVLRICAPIPADDMIIIDRLMRSSETVQARKQAAYIQHEKAVFAALRERWPEPADETKLRLIAMMAIGAVRLASDTLNREGGRRPYAELLREAFDMLEKGI
ncbi:TetR/AcrR family transcriptional regulator [Niveispirillum sp.]|uniref:TetR/AcrR family transcriptional regulator n=1 Tax=Niveispirillum sp. TaxID=1917217 RepID=UPI001B5CAF61|nr:TetR/AcrR family transcriptional regulator [Niveispirillum sp.]MBP7339490.1 TetR family transcriptional regulator [Niveispirillum sp.]